MDQNTPKPSDTLMSISKIQEQLNALNRKMDMILSKLSNNGSAQKPVSQAPVIHKPASQPSLLKNLFQVICADCQKECSIPFKPTADRPVYCKECFARRRSGQSPKVNAPVASKAPEAAKSSAPVPVTKKPAVKKTPAKPANGGSKKKAVKKIVVKKKTTTKKKK